MKKSTPSMERQQRTLPRGIRNNNPLNIRIGNVWLGEVTEPTDHDFEQFVSMLYGLRAAMVLIRRYYYHYRRRSVAAIVSAWAPSTENNTLAYIDKVCALTGFSPDSVLAYEKSVITRLVAAMVVVECGARYTVTDALLDKAFDLA